MSQMTGFERPFSGVALSTLGESYRAPQTATSIPVASTVPLFAVGTTPLTLVTATIHCASIVLPINQTVRTIRPLVVGTGAAVTAFWVALADASLRVVAVSANTTSLTAGFQSLSVLPSSTIPYTTTYAGLFYVALGNAFSTTAPTVGAQAALPSATAAAGTPVYCGTSSTAATATPPAVGTQLGALTAAASNEFYADILG